MGSEKEVPISYHSKNIGYTEQNYVLKTAREKGQGTYKDKHKNHFWFFSQNFEIKKGLGRLLKGDNCQPNWICQVHWSVLIVGERKTFCDKSRLKEFVITKKVLQSILGWILKIKVRNKHIQEATERKINEVNTFARKERTKETSNTTNGKNKYQFIVILNINDYNSLIRGHELEDWTRKQTLYFCCLQLTHILG